MRDVPGTSNICGPTLSDLRCHAFWVTNDAASCRCETEIRMSENGGFRAHHKYMIAAVGVIAVLAFLYNLGIFDVWSVSQVAK
jgi:hypothetical protein